MSLAAHQIVRRALLVNSHVNRTRSIKRGGTGGDSRTGIDVRREGRCLGTYVVTRHRFQVKTVADRRRHRQAHQAASVMKHEVNGFRRNLLRRYDKVSFVLAKLIVHEHDHPARQQFFECLFDGAEPVAFLGHVLLGLTSMSLSIVSYRFWSKSRGWRPRLACLGCYDWDNTW